MRRAFVAPITAGLITLIGCGQSAAMARTTPTAAPSVAASGALTTATTAPHLPGSGQPVTILGVVRSGALPGCTVLLAENGTHYLLLATIDPPRNIPVNVTGVLDTSLVSYCNSGQPLHVQHISRR